MNRKISLIFAMVAWNAVILQYYLMLEGSDQSFVESTVRFFSFFTILTNSLVAVYFTAQVISSSQHSFWRKPGLLTAITVYIFVVGLVYQIVLRPLWNPEGLAKLVDELLHSINPILVLIYWWYYEDKLKVSMAQVPYWLFYPFFYLVYVLIRGHFADFYPYPFINVSALGFGMVALNSLILFVIFSGLSVGIVLLGRRINNGQ
jgi:hypothetical protein